MKFNENLKYLRKRDNLTQEELAEKLNVSRQSITKWESGNSLPDIEKIKEIAYIFSISVDSLIGDIDCKKTNRLKKKINDLGWFISAFIVLAIACNVSVGNFLINVIPNLDYAIGLIILVVIITFIYMVFSIKRYLLDNDERIINMKNNEQGRKERKKYILKKYIYIILDLLVFGIVSHIDLILNGWNVFFINILESIFAGTILGIILGWINYRNLEKKVKELE